MSMKVAIKRSITGQRSVAVTVTDGGVTAYYVSRVYSEDVSAAIKDARTRAHALLRSAQEALSEKEEAAA